MKDVSPETPALCVPVAHHGMNTDTSHENDLPAWAVFTGLDAYRQALAEHP